MTFPSIESVATGTEENCTLNFRGAAGFSGSAGGAGAAATAVGSGAGAGVGTAGAAWAALALAELRDGELQAAVGTTAGLGASGGRGSGLRGLGLAVQEAVDLRAGDAEDQERGEDRRGGSCCMRPGAVSVERRAPTAVSSPTPSADGSRKLTSSSGRARAAGDRSRGRRRIGRGNARERARRRRDVEGRQAGSTGVASVGSLVRSGVAHGPSTVSGRTCVTWYMPEAPASSR